MYLNGMQLYGMYQWDGGHRARTPRLPSPVERTVILARTRCFDQGLRTDTPGVSDASGL
jgi:hypothetical protein